MNFWAAVNEVTFAQAGQLLIAESVVSTSALHVTLYCLLSIVPLHLDPIALGWLNRDDRSSWIDALQKAMVRLDKLISLLCCKLTGQYQHLYVAFCCSHEATKPSLLSTCSPALRLPYRATPITQDLCSRKKMMTQGGSVHLWNPLSQAALNLA